MRDILFRGKRTDNGEWVKGSYVEAKNAWHKFGLHKDWIIPMAFANGGWFAIAQRFPVVGDTIGQFTGIRDKHGKPIFEGDILKWDEKEWGGSHLEEAKWDYDLLDMRKNDWTEWCEIVGNIHDNPDLLK